MATPETSTELIEDDHKSDTRGRRIAGPERRAEIIAGYAASGLTQKAYARREGVNYHTLVAWLGRSRRHAAPRVAGAQAEADAPRFAQLTWPPAAAAIASRLEVVLPDGVTVRGDDAAAMLVLLRALAPRLSC